MSLADLPATAITQGVASGEFRARDIVEASLERIAQRNDALGALTDVLATRALETAQEIDSKIARHEAAGPLAGVPFVAKNLFDIAGLPTQAGSKINRDRSPASADARLIRNLEAAGAILVGAANMGEYAYDFTGENAHDGPSRNPHDLSRMSGGSSGGSASAVASGMVPLSLGSDTNGSIRVPSSFCGLFGLKPTYGRLSRHGTFPFVSSFDHLGPFARSAVDLAASYDAMQGLDPDDPVQSKRPPLLTAGSLQDGIGGLRMASLGGYFRRSGEPDVFAAVDHIAAALRAERVMEWPKVEVARSAAFLMSMMEGAELHHGRLQTRPKDFDPDVRDRLLAGSMLPGHWMVRAQKFRRWYRAQVMAMFRDIDILLAPATPCFAPMIGQKTFILDGQEMLLRPNIGIYTQPVSFIGLPAATVPLWMAGKNLPIGIQIIAAPWREDLVLRVAHHLEKEGVVAAPIADFKGATG